MFNKRLIIRRKLSFITAILLGQSFGISSLSAYNLILDPSSATPAIAIAEEVGDSSLPESLDFTVGVRFDAAENPIDDGRALLRFEVEGAVFASAIQASNLGGCRTNLFSFAVSEGGEVDGSSVVFIVEKLSSCNNETLTLTVSLKGLDQSQGVTIDTFLNDDAFGGGFPLDRGRSENGPLELLSYVNAYQALVESEGNNFIASFDREPDFTQLTPETQDLSIATVTFKVLQQTENGVPVFLSYSDQRQPSLEDFSKADVKVEGIAATFLSDEGGNRKFVQAALTNGVDGFDITAKPADADNDSPTDPVGSALELLKLTSDSLLTEFSVDLKFAGSSLTPFMKGDVTVRLDLAVAVEVDGQTLNHVNFCDTCVALEKAATVGFDASDLYFPWVSSASTALLTGSYNVIRLSNVSSVESGAVLARVVTTTSDDFDVPSPVQELAVSISANGEVVIDSDMLEQAFGDFERGDIEIFVESTAFSLTAMRAVVSEGDATFDSFGMD